MRILGLCLFLALFLSDSFAKGIVPCVSSRSDVEKLLGKDEIPHEEPVGTYHRGKDRVYIDYYSSSSSKLKQVVRTILVYPYREISFRKYTMRLSNFSTTFAKVTLDPYVTHIGYLAHYKNNSEGFEIVTQMNDEDVEIITAFMYYGKESDCSRR